MDSLQYLRSLDRVVLPAEFTYFNHCTYYLPADIKQRMINGKYAKGWPSIPTDNFIIKREMSFVERNERINGCLSYGQPLSKTSIIYKLADYAKPFLIRVIMPKKSIITKDNYNEPYIKELYRIYLGYGDGRHEKLSGNTKLLVFASSQADEISGKKVDIIYCVREIDLEWYASLVKETLKIRTPKEFVLPEQVDRNSNFDFLEGDLLLDKDLDFNRYIRNNDVMSEFEQEYYDTFINHIKKYSDSDSLTNMSNIDRKLIYKTFENTYVNEINKKK